MRPRLGEATTDTTPTFIWTQVDDPSGVTYDLQVSADPSFDVLAIPETTGLEVRFFVPTIPLALGDYFWRVQAVDGAGNTLGFTGTRTFSIETEVPPESPDLVSPQDGEHIDDPTPDFEWRQDGGVVATSYQLFVSGPVPIDETIEVVDGQLPATFVFETPAGTPLTDGEYTWHVIGTSPWGTHSILEKRPSLSTPPGRLRQSELSLLLPTRCAPRRPRSSGPGSREMSRGIWNLVS